MADADSERARQIVHWAQEIERARHRRRLVVKALRVIDRDIRTARKFLRDLLDATQETPEP